MKKPDIETRADIDRLLAKFYELAIHDAEIGHHFVELDLEHHLPIIGDFWEKVLFNNPVYFNNPLVVHQKLHLISPLLPQHFVRWVEIFSGVVDGMFAGETADLARSRAATIADSLDQRLNSGYEIARG
ncbi:MAG: group III truncated hemoglobin [Pyrinomonadaceae bacterium]